jgi:hypothetical protein
MSKTDNLYRAISNKDTRALIRTAVRQGATVTTTGGNHLRLTCPNGSWTTVSLTSRNARNAMHVRHWLTTEGGLTL